MSTDKLRQRIADAHKWSADSDQREREHQAAHGVRAAKAKIDNDRMAEAAAAMPREVVREPATTAEVMTAEDAPPVVFRESPRAVAQRAEAEKAAKRSSEVERIVAADAVRGQADAESARVRASAAKLADDVARATKAAAETERVKRRAAGPAAVDEPAKERGGR